MEVAIPSQPLARPSRSRLPRPRPTLLLLPEQVGGAPRWSRHNRCSCYGLDLRESRIDEPRKLLHLNDHCGERHGAHADWLRWQQLHVAFDLRHTGRQSGSNDDLYGPSERKSGNANALTTVTIDSGTNVTTWQVDNNRTGLNANKISLTPTNVTPSTFGKLFSYQLDGYEYGEPLLMFIVTISNTIHNVVFAATENDSVYAFDADSYGTGNPL